VNEKEFLHRNTFPVTGSDAFIAQTHHYSSFYVPSFCNS